MVTEFLESPQDPAAILLLSIIQGVTEFLPVSSSGHLVLSRAAMGVEELGLAFDVALHVGTLLAVVWAYRKDVLELIRDVFAGKFQMAIWLFVATVPIGVIGVLFKDWIEENLRSPRAAGCGMLFTAALLVIAEIVRTKREGVTDKLPMPDEPTPPLWHALVIGCAQVFAIAPGVSRSGSTIAAALLLGHAGGPAARLSFLMSILAVSGAAVVSVPDAMSEGFAGIPTSHVAGAVVMSALVGWASLKVLLLTLARGSFRWFAAYCTLLGTAAIVWL